MTPISRNLRAFAAELRRRRVHRVGLAYSAGVFVVLQAAEIVFPALGVPDVGLTLLVVVGILGLPVALVLAWVFQITPEGIVRTVAEEGDLSELPASPAAVALPLALFAASIAVLTATSWYFLRPGAAEPVEAAASGATAAGPSELDPLAIAVLPFQQASMGTGDAAFFAQGMHDVVLTQLSSIRTLRVISRTSVMAYEGTVKNVRDIARELGVGTILEGTVQQAGNTLLLNLQLIDARTDTHLWARLYEEEVTLQNVFALQREIAVSVATALNAILTPTEERRLAEIPTRNLEAYEFLLRGNHYFASRFIEEPTRLAIEMYQRATELDPEFALAWARLGQAQSIYYSILDRSAERRAAAVAAVERALELAPDLPDARVSEGYLKYWVFFDLAGALEGLEPVLELRPSDSELLWLVGSLHRRLGSFARALPLFERAAELDPLSRVILLELGITYEGLGRSEGALAQARRLVEVAPDWLAAHMSQAILQSRTGDYAGVQETVRQAVDRFGAGATFGQLSASDRSLLRILDPALQRQLLDVPADQVPTDPIAFAVSRAEAHLALGDTARGVALFDSVRTAIEPRLEGRPGEPRFWADLSLVLARLGEGDRAVDAARQAALLHSTARDPLGGYGWAVNLARILTLVGRHDEAVDQVEVLLGLPWSPSRADLVMHPWLEPLHGLPRYRELARARR